MTKNKRKSPWMVTWLKYVGSTRLLRSEPGNITITSARRNKEKENGSKS